MPQMNAARQRELARYLGWYTEAVNKLMDTEGRQTMEGYVLDQGQLFEEFHPNQARFGKGIVKDCFNNAYAAALKHDLSYVEGFAVGALIPVLHAWCVDDKDRVIDTTWRDQSTVPPGLAYYGVKIPLDYIEGVRERTASASAIDNWEEHWPLLQNPQLIS